MVMKVLCDLGVLNRFTLVIVGFVIRVSFDDVEVVFQHVHKLIFIHALLIALLYNFIDRLVILDSCSDQI